MSKQMRSAYFALRAKDWIGYVADVLQTPMILLMAIAFLVVNTAIFAAAIIVALVVAAMWAVSRIVAILFNFRIRNLGFTEVELERLALM